VNVAVVPAATDLFAGWVVIVGAVLTVSVAAFVATLPELFVNTARNRVPLSDAFAWIESDVEVAPLILLQVAPLSVLNCHCTVGVGVPLAAAVNVTVPFTHVV
jgi:hypothetical protein